MPVIPFTQSGARVRCSWRELTHAYVLFWAVIAVTLLAPRGLHAQSGDAVYGKEMLEVRQCTSCHSIDGVGGGTAPDLGRPSPKDLSPAAVAASMWNHAPAMWQQMNERQIPIPSLSWVDGANFYAYLYSVRYFDPPGDVARGEQVFNTKSCASCHVLRPDPNPAAPAPAAPAVSTWLTVADPVLWMQQMWNHSAGMAGQIEQAGKGWPEFSLQEMSDLLSYLENLPELSLINPGLAIGDSFAGRYVFQDKCSQCHSLGDEEGKIDLMAVAHEQPRLSGLAVKMWNHRPLMAQAAREKNLELPAFEDNEMSNLLAYLFEHGYFPVRGDAERGALVHETKGCASCHSSEDAAAQPIRGTDAPFTAARLVFGVWRHGPEMKGQMNYRDKDWPTLSEQDVADLIEFLNRR